MLFAAARESCRALIRSVGRKMVNPCGSKITGNMYSNTNVTLFVRLCGGVGRRGERVKRTDIHRRATRGPPVGPTRFLAYSCWCRFHAADHSSRWNNTLIRCPFGRRVHRVLASSSRASLWPFLRYAAPSPFSISFIHDLCFSLLLSSRLDFIRCKVLFLLKIWHFVHLPKVM